MRRMGNEDVEILAIGTELVSGLILDTNSHWLAEEVSQLGHEHGEMIRIMDAIYTLLRESSAEDRLVIRDCCARIQDLLTYVEQHEQRENMLVLTVFTQDLGELD